MGRKRRRNVLIDEVICTENTCFTLLDLAQSGNKYTGLRPLLQPCGDVGSSYTLAHCRSSCINAIRILPSLKIK